MTTPSTLPTDWHRSPNKKGPCPICKCPRPRGEHRAALPDEKASIDWIGRTKSSTGGWTLRALASSTKIPIFSLVSLMAGELDGAAPKPAPGEVQEIPKRLANYYTQVYEPLKLRPRAENTRRLYRSTLVSFARFLGRAPLLVDLTDSTVSKYLKWFLDQGRSPYSVNKQLANLLALWRFAAQRQHVDVWPNLEPERVTAKIPQAWTLDELNRLLKACRAFPGEYCGIPAFLWWAGLHQVLWDSGERIHAILSLTWDNVDLKQNWIVVLGEHRKCHRSDRGYRLHPSTTETLRQIRAVSKRKEVFPWPKCSTYLWKVYKGILTAAGLPTDSKSAFHRMRRSVASHVEAAGGNATRLLDHSHRSITVAGYLDPRLIKQDFVTDLLPPMGGQEVPNA